MKLEEKFFNTFFYPFCFGILASIIIVITLLSYYSNDYLDETTAEGVYKLKQNILEIVYIPLIYYYRIY